MCKQFVSKGEYTLHKTNKMVYRKDIPIGGSLRDDPITFQQQIDEDLMKLLDILKPWEYIQLFDKKPSKVKLCNATCKNYKIDPLIRSNNEDYIWKTSYDNQIDVLRNKKLYIGKFDKTKYEIVLSQHNNIIKEYKLKDEYKDNFYYCNYPYNIYVSQQYNWNKPPYLLTNYDIKGGDYSTSYLPSKFCEWE
jgi:hypothetical protein